MVSILDLPSQVLVEILKQVGSLKDVCSFGRACRGCRLFLLETEVSGDLWRKYCSGRGHFTLASALAQNKIQRIFAGGSCRPKPAAYYYRFQPAKNVGMKADLGVCALGHSEGIGALTSELPGFFELVSLGSVPSVYCRFFTLAKGEVRTESSLTLLVYSECTRWCLYEVEYAEGKLVRALVNKTLLPGGGDGDDDFLEAVQNLEAILRKVYLLNKERTEIMGRVSVLHGEEESISSLCDSCALEEIRTNAFGIGEAVSQFGEILGRNTAFVVTVTLNSATGKPSRHKKTSSVNNLYKRCENMKKIKKMLCNKPENLLRLVVHCGSAKEARQYKRTMQSMLDHAFLVNPGL
ncbi:hypothetical protein HOP50_06g44610 [Chloropicon primus]|uniref:F-box domain-containing protein n=1 Tax=Chloropicon primus TaxID=1764295 RepID=A0A5B8MRA3_9CHLO|nr:hypothetical protein A3770_06p44380 [Chloropicon primus]UPR01140.1 hypothetical protein HOP50_06g44610 [Chloropicon primus]|eukprot:QDZ21920.1 hypothetical protein A3770_06p44380 [Chloropicon primus]